MLVNILLGLLGILFGLVTLAALVLALLLYAAAASCDPGEFLCEHGGSEWRTPGLFSLVISLLSGILAFWLWRSLHRRIRGNPDAWWLWYEKRATDGLTTTAEWLRDMNRERAEEPGSGPEAKSEEGDSPR